MPWTDDFDRYQKIAEEIEPASRLVTKDHWIWEVVWLIPTVLTFGLFAIRMHKTSFLDYYATTLFPVQGYPSHWGSLSTRLIVHECRHTTHCVWLGYLIPILGWIPGRTGRHIRAWCGSPFYTIIYALIFFPIGLAFGRFLTELDCDYASWKWQIKHQYKADEVFIHASSRSKSLSSGKYFWSIPRLWAIELYQWAARKSLGAKRWKQP